MKLVALLSQFMAQPKQALTHMGYGIRPIISNNPNFLKRAHAPIDMKINSEEKEQENKGELDEEVKKKIDEDEASEKVDINMSSKEVGSLQETTKEVKEEKEVNKRGQGRG